MNRHGRDRSEALYCERLDAVLVAKMLDMGWIVFWPFEVTRQGRREMRSQ